jgi:hypothetical protein
MTAGRGAAPQGASHAPNVRGIVFMPIRPLTDGPLRDIPAGAPR